MSGLTKNHIAILEVLAARPWEWLMGSSIERSCFQKQGWSYAKTKWLERRGLVENVGGSVRITQAGQRSFALAKPTREEKP